MSHVYMSHVYEPWVSYHMTQLRMVVMVTQMATLMVTHLLTAINTVTLKKEMIIYIKLYYCNKRDTYDNYQNNEFYD